jgi:hypothetical protein
LEKGVWEVKKNERELLVALVHIILSNISIKNELHKHLLIELLSKVETNINDN